MYKLLVQKIVRFHLGILVGMGLFTLSLLFYRSYENRPIFDLWSYPFSAVIILSTILFLIILVFASRARKKTHPHDDSVYPGAIYLELTMLFWGIACFISAIDDSTKAGRITELNFFGSIMPAAVCMEWISMVMLLIAAVLIAYSFLSKKWINTILMLSTILGLMLLFEGIIRFKAIIAPVTQGFPTYTSAIWKRYHVKYNNDGFRDIIHSTAKDSKTRRLLVIGDSYAFGWGIDAIEDRFGSQIGKILTIETKEQWEVINASIGDTHTLEHIGFLKECLIYKPDVILLLYVFNDIDYLYPVTPRRLRSTFSLDTILFKNFFLFQELYLRVYRMKYGYLKSDGHNYDPYSDSSLLSRHLQDLSTFIEFAKHGNAFVRIIPFDISVIHDDMIRERYKGFINSAEVSNIPVWSLEGVFDNYQYSQLVVNNMDRHPNELANRIAAEEIAERLLKEIQE